MKFERFEETLKALLIGLFLASSAMFLSACDEGPLEEAGEEIDDAIDDVEDQL